LYYTRQETNPEVTDSSLQSNHGCSVSQ